MSTVAAGATRARHSVRVAVTDRVALGTLAGLVLILATLTWGTWGSLDGDTGYDIIAGSRIANGELPYVDFLYYYGPLSAALHGLMAALGADGIGGAIALGLVLTVAIIGCTYALARLLLTPLGSLFTAGITAAIAFAPGNFSYVMPHTTAATLGLLTILVALIALGRYARTTRLAWLLGAGAAVGVAFLTKPEFAIPALVAAVAMLVVRARAGQAVRGEARAFALLAAGIPAVVYGFFLLAVSPSRLMLDNLYPADELNAGGGEFLKARAPMTAGSLVDLGAHFALYAAGIAALWFAARALVRGGAMRLVALVAVAIVAVLLVALVFANPEALRRGLEYIYGWIPAGAAIGVAVLIWRGRGRTSDPVDQLRLAACLALAVFAATTYATFYLHAQYESTAVYIAPLAALFLVHLHMVNLGRDRASLALGAGWIAFLVLAGASLAIGDAHSESASVSGPGGTMTARPADAARDQAAVDALVAATAPGDAVLIAPLSPSLYVISGRSNPLDQISLTPGSLPSAAAEERAIRQIDDAGVNVALIDSRTLPGYGAGAFGTTYDRRLAVAIHDGFSLTESFSAAGSPDRSIDLWTRKDNR